MKPVKLVLSAFGPYRDKVEIDFEKLGSQGIFLITGDTGSGKTSIFDGMCFALFGAASGSRRETNSFRSDFASDDISTYVHFSFLHKGILYYIERIPKYFRKKKRGNGNTLVPGDASLTYLDTVITGEKNVTDKCIDILGINVNQFRQIVMIAQGEFMDLLLAKVKDRAEILRHIFDTSVYKAISDKLKDHYLEKKREFEDAKISVKGFLDSIVWNDDVNIENNISVVMEYLKNQNCEDQIIEDKLEKSKKKLDNELSNLIKDISEGTLLQKSINDLENEKNKLSLLLLKNDEIQVKEDKLFRSREIWDKVVPLQDLYDEKIKKYECVKSEINDNQKKYKKLCVQFDSVSHEYLELDLLREKVMKLKEQWKIYQEKLGILDDINRLESEIELKQLSLEYIDYSEKKEILLKFKKLHELNKKFEKSKKNLSKKNDEYFLENQKYLRDYHLFLSAQASFLAKSLIDGEPCPVCGSLEHPDKATYTDNVLSREELDSELAKCDFLKNELDGYVEKIHHLENEIMIVTRDIDGFDEASLLQNISDMESQFGDNFSLPLEERASLEKELSVMEASIIEKKNSVVDLNRDDILFRINNIVQDIEKINTTIENTQKKYDVIDKEKIELESVVKIMKKECLSLKNELAGIKNEYEKSYRDLGYQNKDSYLAFILSRDEMNDLSEEVRLYQEELLTVKTHINALEEFVKDKKIVDLRKKNADKERISSEVDNVDLSLKEVHSRLMHNLDLFDKISQYIKNIEKIEHELVLYKDLSDTANGNIVGQNKLEFEQFVQASYFDQILNYANKRFSYMTDNRFCMVRKDEASKLSDKLGLELEVMDYYTGKRRDIRSLSGGESFKASLALALGMSDTIQMYAGGVVVDAMFIDEGFGSLDSESLESAMNAIMMLSKNDRIIGIVSHVSELKAMIDKKIVVSKGNMGSSVNIIV